MALRKSGKNENINLNKKPNDLISNSDMGVVKNSEYDKDQKEGLETDTKIIQKKNSK